MTLIGKKIVNEYDVPVRMSAEIFLDRHDREKATGSFSVDLVIRGKKGLCCNVRPMKQLGRAAWITFWTAFQNESTSIAACRFRRGLSNVGSTIDCTRGVALRCRFVATVASSRLNYLSQLRSRLIGWGGAKIQLKIFATRVLKRSIF
jgi:hypothetical protein